MNALSRRGFLGAGTLAVGFSLAGRSFAQAPATAASAGLPGSLKTTPLLDSWLRIDGNGHVTVFTGKAELGQGIKTALLQVAAEELDVPPQAIDLVTVDTARTPDEGVTAGSHSMQDSGTAIQHAAATARMLLTQAAAQSWSLDPRTLTTTGDGHVRAPDGRTAAYGDLARGLSLHVPASAAAPLRAPATFRVMGTNFPRVDIPAKVTGGQAYVQDMRLPGMLHARVVRGPSVGTRLASPDIDGAAAMPGVVRVVRRANFTAVVAETEWQAIAALRHLQQSPFERTAPPLPVTDVASIFKPMPAQDTIVLDTHDATAPATRTLKASYSRPWLMHGSIGPSCAVALFDQGHMTIWTHSQATWDVRRVAVGLLGLPPEQVRAIQTEGSGCYGHNGADDVSADAALIAHEMPGRPIRVQWMREQEFGWEPLGSAMVTELEAALDAQGRIVTWKHEIWSNPHNTRPTGPGGVLAGWEMDPPFPLPKPTPIPMPEGGEDRNSNPLYALPNMHVISHFIPEMPHRVSALRSLGAQLNIFSIESMMDELARAAGTDPLDFRLAHMQDARARDAMQKAAATFGWARRKPGNGRSGSGMAFARYKNLGAYCCVMMEIEVERETGAISIPRVVATVDAGQAVSPDGLRNQLEGGILQSISWASREALQYDAQRRTSFDWSSYPILRFLDVPQSVEVVVIDRPGLPFLGAGEASQGPTSAALANALADAAGVRMRELPLSPPRVKAAIGVV